MPESKNKPDKPEELTPEQIKERDELLAIEKADKELNAKIKAAQTRTEKNDDGETVQKRSKCLPVEKERHLFHVQIETPAFDPKTGKRLSKPKTQIFGANEFTNFKNNAPQLGYEMKILWNPEQYK
jgi:hypothetical protein